MVVHYELVSWDRKVQKEKVEEVVVPPHCVRLYVWTGQVHLSACSVPVKHPRTCDSYYDPNENALPHPSPSAKEPP